MDNLSEKLMEMLSNKESIEKIKGLGNLLNLNNITAEKSKEETTNTAVETPSALHSDTIGTMMKLMPILSSINKDDESTRFLFALRPLLSDKRKLKLDESIKIMQMLKIVPLLKSQGIF